MIVPIVSSAIYLANREAVVGQIPQKLGALWKDWDLRLTVLLSLIVQIVLSILGSRKKYNRKLWIRILIWGAYTAADTVAIFALGIVSNNISKTLEKSGQEGHLNPKSELSSFWAQFLLLHLGGPDSITAYALEDNELWLRQLLGLASQAFGAVYVIFLSWTGKGSQISLLSILMFIAGFIKYGERIWVLRTASYEIHRNSVLKQQNLGFSEGITKGYGVTERDNLEYRIKSNEGYIVGVELCSEIEMSINLSGLNNDSISDKEKLVIAFGFLDTNKRVFLDASLSSRHRDSTQAVFRCISSEDAFQINEIQLGMIYDLRYTKAPLLHSRVGLLLRLSTISLICSSLVLFSAFIDDHKHKYQMIDVFITFLLLVVAFLLEIYAILVLIFSDRFALWLIKHDKLSNLQVLISFPLLKSRRWSNSLSQYALLGRKRKPFFSCGRFLKIGTRKNLEWNTQVTKDLKEVIFRYFKEKAEELATTGNNPFTALVTTTNQEEEGQQEQDTSINWQEFEYKIIIWSVVTEVFYYLDQERIPRSFLPYCKAIKRISRYMLYLLVQQPSMISAETGLMIVSFEDITDMDFVGSHESKAEFWKNFLNEVINPYNYLANDRQILLFKNAVELLIEFQETAEQEISAHVSGQVKVALSNVSLTTSKEKWERIGNLWLEMLGYAAAKSKGIAHAQQLGRGGEFLTHVWLLMANFGLTHHFVTSRGRPVGRFIAK